MRKFADEEMEKAINEALNYDFEKKDEVIIEGIKAKDDMKWLNNLPKEFNVGIDGYADNLEGDFIIYTPKNRDKIQVNYSYSQDGMDEKISIALEGLTVYSRWIENGKSKHSVTKKEISLQEVIPDLIKFMIAKEDIKKFKNKLMIDYSISVIPQGKLWG
jgi:hypothetical protein